MKYSLLLAFALIACAAQPWSKDPAKWSADDAQRVLAASPWAQSALASFATEDDRSEPVGPLPTVPGTTGVANSVSDGRWDGGVGKIPYGGTPSLPLTIRWDSALPVRLAAKRVDTAINEDQAQRDYIITVIGLVPAGQYRAAGQLPAKSRSDDDSAIDPQDPETMLEGLMSLSRLMPAGQSAIAPEDVKLDAATGTLHLFFPRTQVISLKDKEVTFATRFGSMTIRKQFRLKDMVYQGKLAL